MHRLIYVITTVAFGGQALANAGDAATAVGWLVLAGFSLIGAHASRGWVNEPE